MQQMKQGLGDRVYLTRYSSMRGADHREFEIGCYEGYGSLVVATRDVFNQGQKTNRPVNRWS